MKLSRSRSVARQAHIQAFATKTCTARPPVLTPVPVQAIHSRACLNLHHCDIQSTAQKSPCVNTFLRPSSRKKTEPSCYCLGAWAGHTEQRQRTRETPHTDNGHVRQQRAQFDKMMVCAFLLRLSVVQRLTRGAERCSAPSSTSEVRMPELAACQSAPAQATPSGTGASSSSSDASAMAHSTESSGAGSSSVCLEKSSSWAWSAAASATASRNSALLPARKRCHPVVHALFSSHKSVAARDAHSAEDWRRHALFMAKPSKEPSRTERASVALACAWVQLLKLRKKATSARVASLAWMLAMSQRRIHDCPSMPGLSTLSILAASCRSVVVVAQPVSDVTWWVRSGQGCSGKTASVLPACTICTSMSSGPRSILKATVNVVASLVLPWQLSLASRRGGPIQSDAPGGAGRMSRRRSRLDLR